MFKTISAAVLAASIIAAPAMAATVIKTEKAPLTKSVTLKPSVARANAKVIVIKKSRHHRHHLRGHRAHKHMGSLVTKKVVAVRTVKPSLAKRG